MVLFSACIPSVNPFYRDRDLAFDAKLLGRWQDKGSTEGAEIWEFAKSSKPDDKSYVFTLTDKEGKEGSFKACLFKLKEDLYVDIVPTDCHFAANQADLVAWSVFPGHLLARVEELGPGLKLSFFDFDWLAKHLEANPGALAHHVEDKRILLTASTPELQRFVWQHRREGQLFQKATELERVNHGSAALNER
jgi:hypothetical protein